jgi:hypothetical protein
MIVKTEIIAGGEELQFGVGSEPRLGHGVRDVRKERHSAERL